MSSSPLPPDPHLPRVNLVVTRHRTLVEFLTERGYLPEGVAVVEHASADELAGRRVLGHLPLHLAALAETVTEPVLEIPAALRGRELSAEELAAAFRGFRTYRVQAVTP